MKKFDNIKKSVWKFVSECMEDNVPVFAAQASFFMVFSAIPFVMLLITLLKYISPLELDEVLDLTSFYVPAEFMSYIVAILIEIFDKSVSMSIVTAISALWLASKAITSLYMGINRIYRPDVSMGFIKSRVLSMIYTIMFIFMIIGTIIVFGFGASIESIIREEIPIFIPIIELVLHSRLIIFVIILTLVFASFYKILPRSSISFGKQLPGAFCASVGWIGFSWIYSLYIRYISNYSYVYGSLAALVFLMLWIYICMNIFLYGAELNKLINTKKQLK